MRIWDFDGVVFNSQGDYSDDFLIWNAHNKSLVATLPELNHRNMGSVESDILITGRAKSQQDMVMEILAYNNLHFDEVFFSDFTDKDFKAKDFFPKYHAWKSDMIRKYGYCQVIDDDLKLLTMLKDEYACIHVKEFTPDLRKWCEGRRWNESWITIPK